MRTRYHYRRHQHAVEVVLHGQGTDYTGSIPVGRLVSDYRREVESCRAWVERMRRFDEYYALRHWWGCETAEQYEECRRVFGEVLRSALKKWHKTARYLNNKKQYTT